ncbi:molybdenum cofactor guanylyltransferase [Nocardioides jishulii]|uniref:Molybdopterin-guanine dinucleotide biosynthesis protein n=1 Tax=Nocardioides jishulii TaxID=2575440 RepID=A0A4U2YSQ8_9ACTN|nr:NTP transferase domain-containing protein [Nocardioides jishulii]TKI64190.1 molybdopterin-guanine dinucleotide biosynthesis protein [Nocardioides jishulii]
MPALPPTFGAVVLTGGTGVRMGGADKAAVAFRGRTLLDHALAATVEANEVVVVGPPTAGVRTVREEPAGGGPAAGLLAGRDALSSEGVAPEWLVALAVDMPMVTPATVRRLLVAADGHDGAVLVDAEGHRQLCVALRTSRLDDVRPADARGLGFFRLLAGLDLAPVVAQGAEASDLDTWADVEALESPDRT